MTTVMERDEALKVVSRNVNQLLAARGWTLSELARRSKNTVMLISRLTRMENMPAGDVLQRIAEAFEVTIDHLFTSSDKHSKISA